MASTVDRMILFIVEVFFIGKKGRILLTSIVWILGLGLIGKYMADRLNIPALLFYLVLGILLGPHAMDLISPNLLNIGPDIKKIALVVILIRAGLTLNIQDLKKVGTSAGLMCVLPATFEIVASLLLAPLFLGVDYLDAFLIGTVIAAVSPAVVVPRMVSMIDRQKGTQEGIPQVILAGASADDIYVLVLFSAILGLYSSGEINQLSLLAVPVSVIVGYIGGWICGYIVSQMISKFKLNITLTCLWVMVISLLLMIAESYFTPWFSGLIAVMVLAMKVATYVPDMVKPIKHQFNQYWLIAEVFLFMLVGMDTNVYTALDFGWMPIVFIILTSAIRMVGVYISLLPSTFTRSEKLFTMGAYLPKATVQAAIGSIPLTLGIPYGDLILTLSVLEILITAPLGALWIDQMQDRLLEDGS